ncbi:MAG: glycerol-3-phosphate 1-O-acyltransferase PlsY [Opitutales bacterium]
MVPLLIILSLGIGYLLGAIPFGYLIARAHGVDILKEGSGNPGATNVKRVVGKRAGNAVFLLDFGKGFFAALWPMVLVGDVNLALYLSILGLFSAIIGHSFSVFLRFRGGKGVATTMGGLVVVMPYVLLGGILVWAIVYFFSRIVSVASLAFAMSLPVLSLLMGLNPLLLYLSLVITVLVFVRHRSNIASLLKRQEKQFSGPRK